MVTVIAVKDGVIAADSMVSSGGVLSGTTDKIYAVCEAHGGGYVAGCGELQFVQPGCRSFATTGQIEPSGGVSFLHLSSDGVYRENNGAGWYAFNAPFYAIGTGADIALGAMAAGASAREAVEIACRLSAQCCEPIMECGL